MGMYEKYHLRNGYAQDIIYDMSTVITMQQATYKKLKQSAYLLEEVMDKVDAHVELVDLRDKIGNFLK